MIEKKDEIYLEINKNTPKIVAILRFSHISIEDFAEVFVDYLDLELSKENINRCYKYLLNILKKDGFYEFHEFTSGFDFEKKYPQYFELLNEYRKIEKILLEGYISEFKGKHPLKDCITKSDIARRNQKFGKLFTAKKVGSIICYDCFKSDGFTEKKLVKLLGSIKLFVVEILKEKLLDDEINKMLLFFVFECMFTKKQENKKRIKI